MNADTSQRMFGKTRAEWQAIPHRWRPIFGFKLCSLCNKPHADPIHP